MATQRRRRDKHSRGSDAILGYMIPVVFCVLAIMDFLRDGQVDKYILGALLIFGLGALGYRIDTIIEKYIESKAGGPPNAGSDGNA